MGKELLFDQNTSILSLIYMIFGAIVFLLFVTRCKRISCPLGMTRRLNMGSVLLTAK